MSKSLITVIADAKDCSSLHITRCNDCKLNNNEDLTLLRYCWQTALFWYFICQTLQLLPSSTQQ